MRLHGRVSDFEGRALSGAEVRVDGRDFRTVVAYTATDSDGMYGLEVQRGIYLHVWICKDYKEKMLEYWAWHVPMYDDLELNARVDGLELYGMDAFWPRQRSTLMVFFRPMSLKRSLAREAGGRDRPGLIDIAPRLSPEDIVVTVDGEPAPLLCMSKVREEAPPDQYLDAYLVHVETEGILATDAYRKISVAIVDRETGERGEGSVFWQHTLYEEGRLEVSDEGVWHRKNGQAGRLRSRVRTSTDPETPAVPSQTLRTPPPPRPHRPATSRGRAQGIEKAG